MSYISSLNLLNDDSPVPLSEEILSEELALWANAQFTFDTQPGTAAHDKTQDLFNTLTHLNELVNPTDNKSTSDPQSINSYLTILPNPPSTLPRIAPAPGTQLPTNEKKRKSTKEAEEPTDAIEDKRRRNTAASARFRMKKKLKEQALERTAQEMTEKAEKLEKRVVELEKEAQWLRALVVEKDPALLDKPSS